MKIRILLAIGCALSANSGYGQSAAGWRGTGTGVFSDQTPPTKWSAKDNVIWSTKMPGRSNAHPVIIGDKVLTCSEPYGLLCLSLNDGKLLWHRKNAYRDVTGDELWKSVEAELAVAAMIRRRHTTIKASLKELRKLDEKTAEDEARITQLTEQSERLEEQLDGLPLAARYTLPATQRQYNGYTTATPTSDGEHVWAVFGNRVVVCYDLNGKLVWTQVVPDNPSVVWGHTSSPLLVGETLIVNIDQIVGFDAKTGKQVWRTKYGRSWGSAVHARIGDVDVALFANGRILRVSDGTVLDRVSTYLGTASPVVSKGIAYYIGHRSGAFPFPSQVGDKLELTAKWKAQPKGTTFFASPVVHNGLVYAVSTGRILNVLDAADGRTVYSKRLNLGSGPVWASLCVAGKNVYISSRDGTTLVIETGRQYKELSRNTLEYFISTPVFHRNRMYVRTSERLFCIGES